MHKVLVGLLVCLAPVAASAEIIITIVPAETTVVSDQVNVVDSFFDVVVEFSDELSLASYNARLDFSPPDLGVRFIGVEIGQDDALFPGRPPNVLGLVGSSIRLEDTLPFGQNISAVGSKSFARVMFQVDPGVEGEFSVGINLNETFFFNDTGNIESIGSVNGGVVTVIPEPTTASLLLGVCGGLLASGRRRAA